MLVTLLVCMSTMSACTPSVDSSTTSTTGLVSSTTGASTTAVEPRVLEGVGVDGDVINIGVMVPVSGPLAAFGRSVREGQSAYWSYVNDVLGGVGGQYEVRVVDYDHRYDVEEATRGFEELSTSVLGFSGALGSLVDEALASALSELGMVMVSGSLSSEWAGSGSIIPNALIPTYRDQVAAGMGWAADVTPAGPSAILFQEGSYGEDCAVGYDRAVGEFGFTNVGRLGHSPGATDFGGAVEQLITSQAATVVVCSTPDALTRIIATADSLDYRPDWLVSIQSFDPGIASALGGDGGPELGLALLADTVVLGAGPGGDSPAALLRDEILADVTDPDWYTMFGYAQAATFHLILEEALEASDLTRAGLQAAIRRLGAIDMGLDGPTSSLSGLVPVTAAAIATITAESIVRPFGIPASEPYFVSPFSDS